MVQIKPLDTILADIRNGKEVEEKDVEFSTSQEYDRPIHLTGSPISSVKHDGSIKLLNCVAQHDLEIGEVIPYVSIPAGMRFTYISSGQKSQTGLTVDGEDILQTLRTGGAVALYDCTVLADLLNGSLWLSHQAVRGDIEFRRCTFKGEVTFWEVKFAGNVCICHCNFMPSASANLKLAQCSVEGLVFIRHNTHASVFFMNTDFARGCGVGDSFDAGFKATGSTFCDGLYLPGKTCDGRMHISSCSISGRFNVDPEFWDQPWWSRILRRLRGKALLEVEGVDVRNCSDLLMRRWCDDEEYIREYRNHHKILAPIWSWTCDYGRSVSAWLIFVVMTTVVFATVFFHQDHGNFATSFWNRAGLSLLYSVSTISSLELSGLSPTTIQETLTVLVARIVGYGMLGLLISIFAAKIGRRS